MEEQCASHRQGDIAGEGGGEGNHARRPEPVPLQLQLPEHEEEKHRSSLPPPREFGGGKGEDGGKGGGENCSQTASRRTEVGAEFPSRENLAGTRGTPKRYFSAKKRGPKKYFPVGTTPHPGGSPALKRNLVWSGMDIKITSSNKKIAMTNDS